MIEVRNLTKKYGQVTAVEDLSFDIQPGIVTGFLGPNGAGKSTTMRMMVGLDQPTSGTCTFEGKTYRELKNPVREVGLLLDAKWIHPKRSARSHLLWMARSAGLPATRVDEVLEIVGLSEVAKKKAGGFSLGMNQRLGLAGALLGDPKVLILDEPVNGLDPEGVRWVRDFVRAFAASGRSVLISSHLLSEMALTADRLVVIGRGRLIADASVEEFVAQATEAATQLRVAPEHQEAVANALQEEHVEFTMDQDQQGRAVTVIPDRSTDEIGLLMYSYGVPILGLENKAGSLEDAFIRMTGDSVQYHTSTPVMAAKDGAQ